MFRISYNGFIRNGTPQQMNVGKIWKRNAFKDSLQELFYTVHKDAMTIIIQIDGHRPVCESTVWERTTWNHLRQWWQTWKARRECSGTISSTGRVQRMIYHASAAVAKEVSLLETSPEEEASSGRAEIEPEHSSSSAWPPKWQIGTISVVIHDAAAALNQTKTSSRKALQILSAAAASFNLYATPASISSPLLPPKYSRSSDYMTLS